MTFVASLWTLERRMEFDRMVEEGYGYEDIAIKLGLTHKQVKARLGYVRGYRSSLAHNLVPDHVLDERDRRGMVDRDTTALLMGDPVPGYSALDRKRAQSS